MAESLVCKTCGETKEAVRGTWPLRSGKPAGRLCLLCHRVQHNLINAKIRATPEGRAKDNEASRLAAAKRRATSKGRAKDNEASRKCRSTPEGKAKASAASLACYYANHEKSAERARRISRERLATPEGRQYASIAKSNWKRKNAAHCAAKSKQYYAKKTNRTPAWANYELIEQFYMLAHKMTIETGILHHVDHIVPLQGKLVSGLHVETNLQVIAYDVNCAKGNKWVP